MKFTSKFIENEIDKIYKETENYGERNHICNVHKRKEKTVIFQTMGQCLQNHAFGRNILHTGQHGFRIVSRAFGLSSQLSG